MFYTLCACVCVCYAMGHAAWNKSYDDDDDDDDDTAIPSSISLVTVLKR